MQSTYHAIRSRFASLKKELNEKHRRRLVGAEAKVVGHGGITLVSKATSLSRPTVRRGLREVKQSKTEGVDRIRLSGGGRKSLVEKDPTLLLDLERTVSPYARGDPQSTLRWSSKSVDKISRAMKENGHQASSTTIRRLLRGLRFSLQSNRKRNEGADHPDRDAQFNHIFAMRERFAAAGNPVISVDSKKKELVGNFKNNGKEWRPTGDPLEVEAYDFPSSARYRVTPYGIFDPTRNEGFVALGISGDTSEFAVHSIKRWWEEIGNKAYHEPDCVGIICDSGGSNGHRSWLWKLDLQKWADELGMPIVVSHYPRACSKWNPIEHFMFSYISINWRGKPLRTLTRMKLLIESTTTEPGLQIQCEVDMRNYALRRKHTKAQRSSINLVRDEFHGEWNYTIYPTSQQPT